ncbi:MULTISPECIES: carbohydrate ABC transporter permease [Cryobacterium]|uniref:Sugar ABC transporter permease n=2 Tax=Cryobacterium TaxID=69578 RepID=A0ABY2IMZ7_9MICO|nr:MULTISPECIES: sugar ABC transporter permease [Cryobacterium]MDY7529199.1 sugar ABC transporter permease [Cryobacterium sp. 10C2]MDY7558642.1 sugar ABC transporter permease [Cryobacterium sp. 10C3]MEB0003202.1 sugar ABC transporter permease [Cryobacterium sp. RTC2.1]MEB0288636.1 sugar ABC transporter permease [Cryobacterium sp. 10S3]MEB0289676.1 sugar ABC transporter permease [Cryobacterium sp. 10C2]
MLSSTIERRSVTPDRAFLKKPGRLGSGVSARRARWGWLFVAPFAVFLVLFLLTPLVYAFILSLQNKTVATGTHWVGLDNYAKAFTDPLFLEGVWLVVRFSIILIPIQMLVSLGAALLLDSITSRFSKFSRLMIFVPYAVPAVIGALMWGFLYSPSFGPAAEVAGWFGLNAPQLLSPDNIFGSLVNVVTWQWAGYYMIIIYAALQGIDTSIYEAAKIDGANAWQTALRIKIPMISSSLVLILVFALIGTLQFFTEPQILRSMASGSITASYTPNIYAYTLAFSYSQFNYASAISFALGLVVFVGSYIFLHFTRKKSGLNS